tara:strand:- start:609 stop:1235 length:627 start_codon:yes stop_codon:yes gene_type:complete
MKLLRETIRKLILEEVCAGATAKIQQGLDEIEKRDLVIQVDMKGQDGYNVVLKQNGGPGHYYGLYEVGTSRLCPTYITMWTDVNPTLQKTGIGAVLYDVAIEVATQLGGYLACDRGSVTDEAKRMWRYYNASDDYEAFQMDTRDGYYTPDDKSDDCKQTIFHRDTGIPSHRDPTAYKEEFMDSPFTKAYRKKRITTIPCLGDRYRESN